MEKAERVSYVIVRVSDSKVHLGRVSPHDSYPEFGGLSDVNGEGWEEAHYAESIIADFIYYGYAKAGELGVRKIRTIIKAVHEFV